MYRNIQLLFILIYSINTCLCNEILSSDIHLIRKGSYGYIKCSKNDAKLRSMTHTWTYNGNPETIFNDGFNTLFIQEAKTSQSGKYICLESGKDDSGNDVVYEHEHRILVFEVPYIVLKIKQKFATPECVKEYDKNTGDQYEKLLCSDYQENCPFKVYHSCSALDINLHTGQSMKNEMQGIATFTIYITSEEFAPPEKCRNDVKCIRFTLAKYLDTLEKIPKKKWLQLLKQSSSRAKWYWSFQKSRKVVMLQNCTEGYVPYQNLVCVSCEPGYYFKGGDCVACPINTYQDEGGAIGRCKPCRKNRSQVSINATISVTTSELTNSNTCQDSDKSNQACKPGNFFNVTSCVPCPENTYQEQYNTTLECTPCPNGTSSSPGSVKKADCLARFSVRKRTLAFLHSNSMSFWILASIGVVATIAIVVALMFSVCNYIQQRRDQYKRDVNHVESFLDNFSESELYSSDNSSEYSD